MVLFGHCRFSSFKGSKRLYFFDGSLSLVHATISTGTFAFVSRCKGWAYMGILVDWWGKVLTGG